MHLMRPPTRVLIPLGLLAFVVSMLAASRQSTDEFPFSVWREKKEVTKIPWTFWIGKPNLRFDFRQELRLSATIRGEDLKKSGDSHDFVLYVRALEQGKATPVSVVTPVYAIRRTGAPPSVSPNFVPGATVNLPIQAIVRPGKYRLEVALLDRVTGLYNTRYEDVTIAGDLKDPLERAFQSFEKVEFVPQAAAKPDPMFSLSPVGRGTIISETLRRATASAEAKADLDLFRWPRPVVLGGSDAGDTTHQPTFVIDTRDTLHLSVITIFSPPETAIRNETLRDPFRQILPSFQQSLSNFLTVFTRLRVARGTAQLAGVDLIARTRVFDWQNLSEVTREDLDKAIRKESEKTVTLDNLAGESDRGRFFRDVLMQRLEEAARDTSGARHAIIVVSARSEFPNSSNLGIPAMKNCRCQIFYVRFALVPNETDDIDNMLKPLRPRVYEPLNWTEFRNDFREIYEQLSR
jgi:hypothetical protein